MSILVDNVSVNDQSNYGPGTPFLPKTWSHSGGTGVGGVLIFATSRQDLSEDVTCAFTYGGVEVPLLNQTDGTWDGVTFMRTLTFLKSTGLPDGTQNVTIEPTGVTTSDLNETWSVVVLTFIAAEVCVDDSAVLSMTTTANPAVSLTASTNAFIAAVLMSDHSTPANITAASGSSDVFEDDHGLDVSAVVARLGPGFDFIEPAGTYSVGWTATSEESVVYGVALIECGASYWGILVS